LWRIRLLGLVAPPPKARPTFQPSALAAAPFQRGDRRALGGRGEISMWLVSLKMSGRLVKEAGGLRRATEKIVVPSGGAPRAVCLTRRIDARRQTIRKTARERIHLQSHAGNRTANLRGASWSSDFLRVKDEGRANEHAAYPCPRPRKHVPHPSFFSDAGTRVRGAVTTKSRRRLSTHQHRPLRARGCTPAQIGSVTNRARCDSQGCTASPRPR
jgi:hypothetical protein